MVKVTINVDPLSGANMVTAIHSMKSDKGGEIGTLTLVIAEKQAFEFQFPHNLLPILADAVHTMGQMVEIQRQRSGVEAQVITAYRVSGEVSVDQPTDGPCVVSFPVREGFPVRIVLTASQVRGLVESLSSPTPLPKPRLQ